MTIELPTLAPCPNLSKRVRELQDEEVFIKWAELGYSQMTKDHSRCNEAECLANDLRPSEYTTKHVQEGCNCPFLHTDPKALLSIYENGSFPVVSLMTHEGSPSINVRPYQPELPYVAISHAISDGRGNVHDPALPLCQVSQIDTYVRKLQSAEGLDEDLGWFWMDTLCIPSHLIMSTAYKEETRASFKQSTEKALGTLVLDADIRQMDRAFTYQEAFLRVQFSSWSSRMWTLEEAVLTPKVFLQLKDDLTELKDIVKRHGEDDSESNLPIEPFLIYDHLRKYLSGDFNGDPIRSAGHLAMLHRALRDRRTSNENDRRLVVANLLGMNVRSLPQEILSQVLWRELKQSF